MGSKRYVKTATMGKVMVEMLSEGRWMMHVYGMTHVVFERLTVFGRTKQKHWTMPNGETASKLEYAVKRTARHVTYARGVCGMFHALRSGS